MNLFVFKLIAFCCLSSVLAAELPERNHKKRQIYREQVLPHAGGKIPDTAFETDRLFLNRLQKEGIAVPDGIVTEQRNPQVYQYYNKPMRTVFHIALSSDGRYTPEVGRYHYKDAPTVETTYLYPQAVGQPHVLNPPAHVLPVYRQIQLHNPQLNQIKLQPRKKTQHYLNVTPTLGKSHANSFRTQYYQNVNLLNTPLIATSAAQKAPLTPKSYLDSYGSPHLFSEFDDLFNKFDLHQTAQTFY